MHCKQGAPRPLRQCDELRKRSPERRNRGMDGSASDAMPLIQHFFIRQPIERIFNYFQ
jgi:hypothetical protein